MTILLDVDCVVADLMPEWLRRYNLDYDDNRLLDEITHWDMTKFVKTECGKRIYGYLSIPDLYNRVEPVKGAIEGIDYLRSRGWKIVYVSAGLSQAQAKYDWLLQRGLLHNEGEYIAAYDKSLIRGDVLIDDRMDNVRDFPGASILFTQPWNAWVRTTRRMNGWSDIERWL